jgi:glycosyltransferase involved in cell wall biosynthesis
MRSTSAVAKILLSYIGYPCSAGKYLKKALKNLGHEVVHIGQDTKGFLPWQPSVDFSKYADTPDIPFEYNQKMSLLTVEAALEQSGPVDMIIQCDANFHIIGKAPVPNIVWLIDNHTANYNASCEKADVLFGAHSWGNHSQDKNFIWLPCAYSPSDHFVVPDATKTMDLIFAGVIYAHRAKYLEAIAPLGKVGAAMGVLGEEYNTLYNSARIGLCASFCGDVPMRVFENAAQGLCVFADRQRDLSKLGLKEGRHYVAFSSIDEAVNKFKWLMDSPEIVEQIANAGRKALSKETYESRVETMFSYL